MHLECSAQNSDMGQAVPTATMSSSTAKRASVLTLLLTVVPDALCPACRSCMRLTEADILLDKALQMMGAEVMDWLMETGAEALPRDGAGEATAVVFLKCQV